jgi:hypothetical protein
MVTSKHFNHFAFNLHSSFNPVKFLVFVNYFPSLNLNFLEVGIILDYSLKEEAIIISLKGSFLLLLKAFKGDS